VFTPNQNAYVPPPPRKKRQNLATTFSLNPLRPISVTDLYEELFCVNVFKDFLLQQV
jgi:hypothetical protein